MTKERDLKNLSQKDKYLKHKYDACPDCKTLSDWIDATTKRLRKELEHDDHGRR